MASSQDITDVLLQKARERRQQKNMDAMMQREKTGAQKLTGTSIASGIRSPVPNRKIYNSSNTGAGQGLTGGVAGGVRGARPAPKREVQKATPLDEIEDDFECLQEQLQSRFKRNSPDFKENLLSSNNILSPSKKSYFNTNSPTKPYSARKFFPEVKASSIEKEPAQEPVPPKRTESISAKRQLAEPTPPKRTTSRVGDMMYKSPVKSNPSKATENMSPTKNMSPSKVLSPLKNTSSFSRTPLSPLKTRDTSVPFRSGSSFRSHGSPASISPKKLAPASPVEGPALRTMPSIRLKPNSLVSRALAKLQNNSQDNDENVTTQQASSKTMSPSKALSPVKPTPTFTRSPVKTKEPTITPQKEKTPDVVKTKSNTTVDDSMFIRNNMSNIQHDLDDIKHKIENSGDVLMEQDEEEEMSEQSVSPKREPAIIEPEKLPATAEEILGDTVPDYSTVQKTVSPPEYSTVQKTVSPRKPLGDDGDVDLDDSFDDLCNDILPSPTPPVPAKDGYHEDGEWFDFSSPDTSPKKTLNTSLKRDVQCLADSIYSSVESFTSTPTTTKAEKVEKKTVLSPVRATKPPPTKKLRRSMSVSDIHTPKSPSRFVRLDAVRCSSTSLDTRTRSSTYSTVGSTVGRTPSSVSSLQTPNKKVNTYKGPLEQGTLELRPPFEQLKVLEQGIMIQRQLESQASQLLEHCTYGLEQVEAEKVLVIAGLKKDLWKYHLNEMKGDNHKFNTDGGLPKGTLLIEGISLLLRQDYLVNQVVETKRNQAFFVAVKVSPYRLLTTNTATSECNLHATNLSIPDSIFIDNLPPNYKLTLEVYCMTYNQFNNATPSSKKKKTDTLAKSNTPKRLLQSALTKMGAQKHKSDRTFSSTLESYRGSKTELKHGSKFVLAGSLTLTIKDVKNKQFRLRRAPFHSPFEGTINLSMSAKESITSEPPTHKGFLTIFQEESGLGAWNRRWCSVQDNKIYYWLYPEDQVNQNKEPHGEIDLRHCKTDKVAIASRLDCARPNTFVLLIETPAAPGDRNSIITETDSKVTQTKYLLSADSRQERKEWMTVLNQCLLTIVSWNTK